MRKKLRDAVRRFIKLYTERNRSYNDDGYERITEELCGVADEIKELTRALCADEILTPETKGE